MAKTKFRLKLYAELVMVLSYALLSAFRYISRFENRTIRYLNIKTDYDSLF